MIPGTSKTPSPLPPSLRASFTAQVVARLRAYPAEAIGLRIGSAPPAGAPATATRYFASGFTICVTRI
jgi:hypothetical protein